MELSSPIARCTVKKTILATINKSGVFHVSKEENEYVIIAVSMNQALL